MVNYLIRLFLVLPVPGFMTTYSVTFTDHDGVIGYTAELRFTRNILTVIRVRTGAGVAQSV